MRKRIADSERDRKLLKNFREHLLDKGKMRAVADAFIEKSVAEMTEGGEENAVDRAITMIDTHARSPIERLFFNSFLLGVIKWEPLGFMFHEPPNDAPAAIQNYYKNHEDMRRSYELYRRETGDRKGKGFPDAVQRLVEAGAMSKEQGDAFVSGVIVMYQLNIWNAMHFALQPRFPGFGQRGRAITSDLLVWVPGKRKLKIIVECDGFIYHSTKEAFVADRRRDRVFQQHGYRVLRYSGQEIHADPVGMSSELYDALHAIAGPKKYHPLGK